MLATGAEHPRAGMHVSCEHVAPGSRDRVVCPGEWCFDVRAVDTINSQRRWRIPGATIVIAAHEEHPNLLVSRAPCVDGVERCGMAPLAGMQEISEEYDASSLRRVEQGVESRERSGRGLLGHEDTGGAKGRSLAEVRIGDEQARSLGQYTARSGSSTSSVPLTSIETAPEMTLLNRSSSRALERELHAPDAIGELLGRHALAIAVDDSGNASGVVRRRHDDHACLSDALQRATEPAALELPLEHFALRLREQQVRRVVCAATRRRTIRSTTCSWRAVLPERGKPGNTSPATRASSRNCRFAISVALSDAGMSSSSRSGENKPSSSASSSGGSSGDSSSKP